jgi:hypothetical protein
LAVFLQQGHILKNSASGGGHFLPLWLFFNQVSNLRTNFGERKRLLIERRHRCVSVVLAWGLLDG